MKVWVRILLFAFAVIGILGLSYKTTGAAGAVLSFTTSPVSLGVDLKPGAKTTEQLEIMNNGSQPVQIVMQVKTFGAQGTTGQASITNFSSSDPAVNYISLSPSSFIAQPSVWSKVTATISLPKSAQLGYYYAVVFQPSVNINPGPRSSLIKGDNAILMLVDTGSANESRNVEVANFSANKHLFEYLPVNFKVNIRNKGNIYLSASGDIYISRHANGSDTIDTLPINTGGGNVLPDSNRIFTASWSDGFPVFEDKYVNGKLVLNKKSNPVLQLKWNLANANKFRFGKYYATLAMQYNNGKQEVLLKSVISFWVLPLKIMIVLFIVLLLLLFGLFLIVRAIVRRVRKLKNKNKKP